MPASQLSQLKAALQGAGLNRKSVGKKDKKAFKKGGAREVDRQKKFDKLDDIRKSLNKFDERETKTKYDVGGRKLSGVTGRPSAAKQAGLEQRRKTLLPEHQLRAHMGTFNDRRFGESNPSLSVEEKLQERYTRERQRGQGRRGMFNLEEDGADLFGFDDEGQQLGGSGGGGLTLTHGGRSVNELKGDDFVAQGFGEDDDEGDEERGRVGRDVVRRAHFGGFEQGDDEEDKPERKRSRQEIMNEVIAKSKEHKYARQQQQEEDAEIRDELDADIADLQALLAESAPSKSILASSKSALSGEAAYAARLARTAPAAASTATGAGADQDGTYDSMVRELAFDARAKPKDRTKTEDELAKEEKDKLEAAEAKRLRRMRGEESDDEDEDEEGGGRGRKRRKGDKGDGRREGDDLDDDYVEEDLLGPGLTREDIENMGQGAEASDEEEDEEDGSEDGSEDNEEGSGSDEEGEGEDEDEDGDDDDDDNDDDESDASSMADLDDDAPELLSVDDDVDMADEIVKGKKKRDAATASKGKAKAVDIPYTFSCPATIEEFEDIMEPLDDSALTIVVQRIRALHHPSLAEGNKDRLQNFLGVLLDCILLLASRPAPAFQLISSLYPHIVALVKLNPITAAHHFLAKLALMQKNLTRGLGRGAADPRAKTWPGAAELTLLRMVGMIWSTSDFSHPVVAPAMLLMGQYLSQGRVRGTADLGSGLFLCSLVAQFEAESKRIMPEALNFLGNSVSVLLKRRKDAIATSSSYPDVLAPEVELYMTSDASPSQPADLASCLGKDEANSDKVKADLLAIALRLVPTYASMYAGHEAFVELFTPVKRILEGSRVNKLSPELKTLHSSTLSTLSRQLANTLGSRAPLAMQAHKPVPIASHAPKFESDFAPGKHYDPDVERGANAKLKSLYKKERKGAIRELRKDNRFLADHKAREQKDKDDAYNAKMRRVEGSLQSERAEEKGLEREKAREKRRAGRG